MDYHDFISKEKSLLIAPAGYGKTHTIAECLKYTEGKQLILTHTHAGVAAIKDRLKKANIPSTKFSVETISSFCQRYYFAFQTLSSTPNQDSKEYFPHILHGAIDIVKIKLVLKVISQSYEGLFVDEYQDCTKSQHLLIKQVSTVLPTRLLGDPLQGIFNFNGEELVKWDVDLIDYENSKFELNTPHRWNNTNQPLGQMLVNLRSSILNGEPITMESLRRGSTVYILKESDIYRPGTTYYKLVSSLISSSNSILVLHPDSSNFSVRKNILKLFGHVSNFKLLESIDSADFYTYARKFDDASSETIYKDFRSFLLDTFKIGEVKKWFGEEKLINKRQIDQEMQITKVKSLIMSLETNYSHSVLSDLFQQVQPLLNHRFYRSELFFDMQEVVSQAAMNEKTIYEQMCILKNRKRRGGRNVKGKVFGTTLLTKGLEFETVIVLNAHQFKDYKNLYVAMTRASKELVIISEKDTIGPF